MFHPSFEFRSVIANGVGEMMPVTGSTGRTVETLLTLVCSSLTAKPARSVCRSLTMIGRIELRAVEQAFAGHVGCHIVEHQVAEDIGNEIDLGVARIERELRVAVGALLLPGRDIGDVGVVFILVEQGGIEIRRTEISERHLIGVAGYLEGAVGRRRDHAKARRFIEQGRGVAEELALLRVIVNGIGARRRILKSEGIPIAACGDEVFACCRRCRRSRSSA